MSQSAERDIELQSNNKPSKIKEFFTKAFKGFMNSKTFWTALAILVILFIISTS